MKPLKLILPAAVGIAIALVYPACNRAHQPDENAANAKAYPLDTCLVCGMKLSMMGTPVTFVYQGRQIKVCDAGEKADFKKAPSKFMKKLEDAQAGLKK